MANINKTLIIKVLEVILACVLIGLHYHSLTPYNDELFLVTGTFVGYLIILVGLFAGGAMGTPVNRRVELFFLVVGCALFIASGALIVDRYQHGSSDRLIAKGSISIIQGVILFVDAILTFRGDSGGDE